jgi:glutamate racemase
MTVSSNEERAIGIFDSGVGGLTVLREIRELLPQEHLTYLGDTARLPYGTKSPASISQYARQAAAHLVASDIKLLVVACNTASAVALATLQQELAPLPVVGVVEPGARAAIAARPGAHHLVLATEATVRLGAYGEAIRTRDTAASVDEMACELLVALAEEGWTTGKVADAIVDEYLRPVIRVGKGDGDISSVILGCTHFPLLQASIRGAVGDDVSITDSASTTAAVVARELARRALLRTDSSTPSLTLRATDGARRFARVGGSFLGSEFSASAVELVDL